MNYYNDVNNYFNGNGPVPSGMEYGTANSFNSVNIPYNGYLLPSNSLNRQGAPSPGSKFVGSQIVQSLDIKGPQNSQAVKNMNNNFLNVQQFPTGVPERPNPYNDYTNETGTLQNQRPGGYPITENQVYTTSPAFNKRPENPIGGVYGNKFVKNYYVEKASESLHQLPDTFMTVFFSDENIQHLRTTVVQKVKEITTDSGVAGNNEGVTIQLPNLDDFFYYMVNIFQNYKIHNGSICFVNFKNSANIKSEIAKLNTNVLQEYVSKMVSQINMYIYYYKDASQLPDQLSQPVYTSMKGSRELEYNTGFQSGNSMGIASYNQVGNIF
jgi:hypothetical protein